jgi:single-stranded-DNA-specific exonuclease
MTNDVQQAAYLAQALDIQNSERQKITKEIQVMAETIALAEDAEPLLLFAAHQDFNPGVVGLAASRLTDKYYRPAIVAHQDDEFTRASCRSIPELHITEALDQCAALLLQHGGHAAAAGFTIRTKDLPELKERLSEIVQKKLMNLDLRPVLQADIEIPLVDLRPELLKELDDMQPTGSGNPPATFLSRNLKVLNSRTVGRDNSHLKLIVSDSHITYDAIAFRQGHWQDNMPARVDIIYRFELNEYNGRKMLQLNVSDLKPTGQSDQ